MITVTQKVVSKSEGRFVDLETIEPSPLALELATNWEKDARHVEVVLRESKRIVRMDHGVIICETRHGLSAPTPASTPPTCRAASSCCCLPTRTLRPGASARADGCYGR